MATSLDDSSHLECTNTSYALPLAAQNLMFAGKVWQGHERSQSNETERQMYHGKEDGKSAYHTKSLNISSEVQVEMSFHAILCISCALKDQKEDVLEPINSQHPSICHVQRSIQG